DLLLIVVDRDIQRAECPHHPVDRANRRRHALDRLRIKQLTSSRWFKAKQTAVLIADEDSTATIRAQIDPGALLARRHRVQQLDAKTLGDPNSLNRSRAAFVSG